MIPIDELQNLKKQLKLEEKKNVLCFLNSESDKNKIVKILRRKKKNKKNRKEIGKKKSIKQKEKKKSTNCKTRRAV